MSDVLSAARDVSALPSRLAAGTLRGLNKVSERVRDKTVQDVTGQVNLPFSYVDSRVSLKKPATNDDPKAVISAPFRETLLTRFGAAQRTKPDAWTLSKYSAKFGAWNAKVRPAPGAPFMIWTTRTGSATRGIAPGQKAAGVAVAIRAGSTVKTLRHAFMMPLVGGNGSGVFVTPRSGGKPKARYGPSVYQIAQRTWRDGTDKIADQMREEIGTEISTEVDKVLAKT